MTKKIVLTGLCLGMTMSVAFAKTYLIDIREPGEIAETGKVQGALNADYRSPDFIGQIKALNISPTDKVQLYCRTGIRAGRAKEELEALGYKDIENLGGYDDAAKKLNLPLVK